MSGGFPRGRNTQLLQLSGCRVGLPGCVEPGMEAGVGRGGGEHPKNTQPLAGSRRSSAGVPGPLSLLGCFAGSMIVLVCLSGCNHQTVSHPVAGFN